MSAGCYKKQRGSRATHLHRAATGATRHGDTQLQQRRLLVEQLRAKGGSEALLLLQLPEQLYLLRLQRALARPHGAHGVVVVLAVDSVSGILGKKWRDIMV
jgi:hypothetical protein